MRTPISTRALRGAHWIAATLLFLGSPQGAGWGLAPGSALAAIACPPQASTLQTLLTPGSGGGTNVATDRFGAAVAWGDFDNNGYDDLVVGAPDDEVGTARSGAVFVFPGSSSGPRPGFILTQSSSGGSNEAGDKFGFALAVGDFNQDGYDDLVVGAPYEDRSAADAGIIYLFNGSASGLGGGTFKDQSSASGNVEAHDHFGYALAVGDFNKDTYPDLAVSAPNEDGAGAVSLLRGSSTGLQAWAVKNQTHGGGTQTAGDRFGDALAAGDHNGDGYADLFIGAPYEDLGSATDSGAVFLFKGSSTGIGTGTYFSQIAGGGSDEVGDHFGAALALGDFNGDGKADLAVGAPDEAPGSAAAGGVFYIFAGTAGSLSGYSQSQGDSGGDPIEAGDRFGKALAARDIDADGYADLVVGAPGEALLGSARAGAIFLYAGTPRNIETGRRLTQQELGSASETDDAFGAALAIGDANGDGKGDLAVGVPGEAPYSDPSSGMVGVYGGLVPGLSLGPVAASVTDSSVKIWARGYASRTFRVQYKAASSSTWLTSAEALFDSSKDFTAVLTLTGLVAGTAYDYRPVVDCDVDVQSQATLRTLKAAGTAGTLRFTFGADVSYPWIYESDPAKSAQVEVFDKVAAMNPDFMLLIGDLMYADHADVSPVASTLDQYLAKYRNNWAQSSLRSFMRQYPMFMMWDDHEIVNDWDAGKTGRYLQARPAYETYVSSQTPAPRTSGELYYSFRAGQVDFYVLDVRSFRSPNSAPDTSTKTLLGPTQKADLKSWLSASTAKFKFLVSSVPWSDFGTTSNDSWAGFKTERAELFNYIKNNNIRGVVLLSGDQHWSGVFKLSSISPYNLYEFMPTPVATSRRAMPASTDPQILFKYDATPIYGVFDVNTTVSPATLTVQFYDYNNVRRYGPLVLSENSISP
jgi:hypothetical protein